MSWKQMIHFPGYEVSHKGKVRNIKTKKPIRGSLNEENYRRVTFSNNGTRKHYYIHRVVASLFVPNEDPLNNTEVHHLNNIRDDNRSCNLKWVTHEENMKYVSRYYNNKRTPTLVK